MCWCFRANERAVRIPSANATRKMPTAAGRAERARLPLDRRTTMLGRPLGTEPTTATPRSSRSSHHETATAPPTTTAAGAAGSREATYRSGKQRRQRAGPDEERRPVRVEELAQHLGDLGDRVSRVDVESEQLPELRDHEHHRDAVQVADEDGREKLSAIQPRRSARAARKQAATSTASAPASSTASPLPAAASGRIAAATSAESEPSGPITSLARGAEQDVEDRREQERVETVDRREAGELSVGHRRRKRQRRHGDAGEEVTLGVARAVPRQLLRGRGPCARGAVAARPARTATPRGTPPRPSLAVITQRKPMWPVEVSIVSPCRAAGR